MVFEQPHTVREDVQRIKERVAALRAELSEYQVQAFDVWRELGFCDPTSFAVYHDGERGYHVTEYFEDNPALLAELEQLTKKIEEAPVAPERIIPTTSERTQAHLARTRELFNKPFQMPIPGRSPKAAELPLIPEHPVEYIQQPSWRDRALRLLFQ